MLKLLTVLHRWLGVVLGLFFAMWFFSGIVMMYVPFPSLSNGERLSYLQAIDGGDINVSPRQAMEQCGSDLTDGLRLISIHERPVFLCSGAGLPIKGVYGDSGVFVAPLGDKAALKMLHRVTSKPSARITRVDYDQWTVHQRFDALRPFYRIEVQDTEGTHWYVSTRTAEFVQRTTESQRFWNYFGAVAHWIYPTVLRKHWALWDAVVWWLSAFGVLCAVIGIYLGVSHWVKLRRSGRFRISPFRGWMKWHHLLGLSTGLIIVSWIFSGWLSMDHGRLFSVPAATAEQKLAVQGLALSEANALIDVETLEQYQNVQELRFYAFGGAARIVARTDKGVVRTPALKPQYIADIVEDAFPDTTVLDYGIVPDGDTYTSLREGRLPAGTVRVKLSDANSTWVHVDPYSGEIVSVIDSSRRAYRWLFNGLHSLDVPGLVDKRPLWDAVMLILLVSGLIGSLTGVVVGLKRLFRTVSR